MHIFRIKATGARDRIKAVKHRPFHIGATSIQACKKGSSTYSKESEERWELRVKGGVLDVACDSGRGGLPMRG
jgi:hypothetical protein